MLKKVMFGSGDNFISFGKLIYDFSSIVSFFRTTTLVSLTNIVIFLSANNLSVLFVSLEIVELPSAHGEQNKL